MDFYLSRCLELARLPGSIVEPNPRVGSVVVHQGNIIGEGWHQQFGGPHAEVNAIRSVQDLSLLPESTIYVSLEPCNHQGKTPPCTDLILKHKIPKVVIGSLDPNPKMAGRSVNLLRSHGVEVEVNDEPKAFLELNSHFWCNQHRRRPYITLKWAESKDGFIAQRSATGQIEASPISQPFISRWVHFLRSDHHAILVGKNTVTIDNPTLTTRKWPGPNPIRIFFDRKLEIPHDSNIYGPGKIVVINELRNEVVGDTTYFVPVEEEAFEKLDMLLTELYGRLGIGSILVEGGANLLEQFISQGIWDESWRNVGNENLIEGVRAPEGINEMDLVTHAPGELWHKKNPALRFP